MTAIRTRFVLDVADVMEKTGSGVPSQRSPALLASLRSSSELTVAMDTAADVLFGLDGALGRGAATLLEQAFADVLSRLLASTSLAVPGDLAASAARLRVLLEHIIASESMAYDVSSTREGFTLFVGIGAGPKATRLLRHIAVGAVRAAQRFAREGMTETVDVTSDVLGQRVKLDVRLRHAPISQPKVIEIAPGARTSRPSPRRHSSPTLQAVERIMGSSRPGAEGEEDPVRSKRSPVSQQPDRPPRSDTLKSAVMPPSSSPDASAPGDRETPPDGVPLPPGGSRGSTE